MSIGRCISVEEYRFQKLKTCWSLIYGYSVWPQLRHFECRICIFFIIITTIAIYHYPLTNCLQTWRVDAMGDFLQVYFPVLGILHKLSKLGREFWKSRKSLLLTQPLTDCPQMVCRCYAMPSGLGTHGPLVYFLLFSWYVHTMNGYSQFYTSSMAVTRKQSLKVDEKQNIWNFDYKLCTKFLNCVKRNYLRTK